MFSEDPQGHGGSTGGKLQEVTIEKKRAGDLFKKYRITAKILMNDGVQVRI